MLQRYGGEELCKHSSVEERLVVLRVLSTAWNNRQFGIISRETQLEMLIFQLTATVDLIVWL